MEKNNMTIDAKSIQRGLTPPTLYNIGATLGITPGSVDDIRLRKRRILNSLLLIAVTLVGTCSCLAFATPSHYNGVGIQDFDRIGQGIYQMFGRL